MSSLITQPTFTPLDPRKIELDPMLSNLQGNILKGHGRDNTVHLLVRFTAANKKKVCQWLGNFASQYLTSFKEQLRQRELYKRNKVPGGLFAGLYLTSSLYTFLGLPLDKFGPQGEPFVAGMKASAAKLNDHWDAFEQGYREEDGPIHAMILLAHDDIIELGKAQNIICRELTGDQDEQAGIAEEPLARIVTTEYGSAIRNANNDGLEHFGYVDGISQPLFLKDEVEEYFRSNDHGVHYDPSADFRLVLVPDPMVADADAFGSYFVYRKLEQDVAGFKMAEAELAKKLGLKNEDRERAGAMIIGRFEDGTPLTLSGNDKMIGSGVANNFNYQETIGGVMKDDGGRCPFHAHIRKTNPRRPADPGAANSSDDQQHRMARRGITYGHRNVSTTSEQHFVQMPKGGVGLLFMSFQADINNQFEVIQRHWANNADFEKTDTGMDLIIGQVPNPKKDDKFPTNDFDPRLGKYPTQYNKKESITSKSFASFVKLLGGGYFFAPSIPFLLRFKHEDFPFPSFEKQNIPQD